jgi:protocatechuate 3,4-dioxygenase beta subunit
MKRRELLTSTLKTLGAGAMATLSISSINATDACQITAQQPEGPFYPINDQNDKDNDLTQINGSTKKAIGEVVVLKGIVNNELCRPVEGAIVEIWQACETGKYNHPADPNNSKLDANFQYWGRAITDKNGNYSFKTIKPGSYPAGNNWVRPPHIHVKVHLRGYEELTTQIYFAKDKRLNNRDLILMRLTEEERNNVIVNFETKGNIYPEGQFNITLKGF